ncbi:MAG: hypothetical protein HY881_12505 [Deltaproteobacteria bacterium]|nr:hypothetical protein [Deltaproteobacteria bacterium]
MAFEISGCLRKKVPVYETDLAERVGDAFGYMALIQSFVRVSRNANDARCD